MQPFIVYALPRSRTAWLSDFLSYNEWTCGHEQAIFLRSVHDIQRFFALPYVGTVETAAAQAWRLIYHHAPHLKVAVVRRDIDDVMESMLAVDLEGYATYDATRLRKVMEYGNRMLDQISALPNTLTLSFDELDTREGCQRLFEHCLPYRFCPGWWEMKREQNIQAHVPSVIRYYHENRPAIERFKSDLRTELRHLVRSGEITRH